MMFKLVSSFRPKGSQPEAIKRLVSGFKSGKRLQTLLGVTGSGKTFTMANVIARLNRPALVLAHNKTLAAQLYSELREFFPHNRVEYFVSYYDYYQPESYIPHRDLYIEKDAAINPKLEQMRLAATASLMSRKDVIVVASVSCIYGLGSPDTFRDIGFELRKGSSMPRRELLSRLVRLQFERNDTELAPGRFRARGDTVDLVPGYFNNIIRLELFGDQVERITEIDRISGEPQESFEYFYLYPAKHFVMTKEQLKEGIASITKELKEHLPGLGMLESHRLRQRTMYDIEMLDETGYCKGIENYSRHFDGRSPGEKPYTLLDYFPRGFLFIIDESHQTIPQLHGMYNGDKSRKKALVDYGFRLPSAFDNRPLMFHETEAYMDNVLFVSATPGEYELRRSAQVVEQIIRPTGLIDPVVEVRPVRGQMDDIINEINLAVKRGDRALITTLTKKLAEELAEFLASKGVKTRYLHSEIDTLERTELIRQLRLGKYDVLVGINLLREGLDIPEVGFIGILDADKEGFLRDARSLIQTIGRAARNINSKVVLYADRRTDSILRALAETRRRRRMQAEFNKRHRIKPRTIVKPVKDKAVELKDTKHIPKADIPNVMIELEARMNKAADRLDFEQAIFLRDRIRSLNERLGSKTFKN